MKFGFFGNTNNYPFVLARALQALGHSIFFVVTEKDTLHRPESLYREYLNGYPDWILDLSHLDEWAFMVLHPGLAIALTRLSQCDALILNSTGPSLLPYLNKPAITFLTGWDLSNFANPASVPVQTSSWEAKYKESSSGRWDIALLHDFVARQRKGIQSSIRVRYFPSGYLPDDDKILEELGVSAEKRFFLYYSNLEQLDYLPPPDNQPIRVFCGARLTWKLPIEPGRSTIDYKGGDVMIRGLGLFYRETGMRLDIHLVRKGLHVKETEELIAGEGIVDQVTWHEEMPQVEYFKELARADIIFDQLGDSLPGLVSLDAMAIGRPVIVNGRRLFTEFAEPHPICQAKTAQEVCEQLKQLVFHPEKRIIAGRQGRRFVEEYLSPEHAAKQIEKIFKESMAGRPEDDGLFSFDYDYLLEKLEHTRKDSIHFETNIQQDLDQTRHQLDFYKKRVAETAIQLEITTNALDRYVKFFRPVKFILNLLRKIPFLDRYLGVESR